MNHVDQIILGDCVEIMNRMPADSIAACVTDPPYNYEFIGRDWNDAEISRRLNRVKNGGGTLVKNIPYGSGLAGGVRDAKWYERNRRNALDYTAWCETWGRSLFRVCKPGAPVAVFSSSRTVAHVQVALETAGFYARDVLVYRRHSGIPKGLNLQRKLEKMNHPDAERWAGWHTCFRNEWEAIALLQKPLLKNYWNTIESTGVGAFKTINDDGSFQSNILEGYHEKPRDKAVHCTVKPLGLLKKLIETLVPKSDDNVVLDPFAGSGTTLVAAKELGFHYAGVEINPDYVKIIKRRLDGED